MVPIIKQLINIHATKTYKNIRIISRSYITAVRNLSYEYYIKKITYNSLPKEIHIIAHKGKNMPGLPGGKKQKK